jgi:hypothetical protein
MCILQCNLPAPGRLHVAGGGRIHETIHTTRLPLASAGSSVEPMQQTTKRLASDWEPWSGHVIAGELVTMPTHQLSARGHTVERGQASARFSGSHNGGREMARRDFGHSRDSRRLPIGKVPCTPPDQIFHVPAVQIVIDIDDVSNACPRRWRSLKPDVEGDELVPLVLESEINFGCLARDPILALVLAYGPPRLR